VIGHSDMSPGRKTDPGARFDWQRLARAGLSIWPAPVPVPGPNSIERHDPTGFRDFAQMIGYDISAGDDVLLAAFRLRFRPWAKGPLDATDLKLAEAIAKRVDRAAPEA
ncbi:MAG: N-acetylmuramoyl-L-alanine amidase, partial [Pseudorhodobacter sp.]